MTTIKSRCKAPASLVRTSLLAAAVLCWAAPAHADQSTSFVWVADTRGNNENDLVDTSVLTPIVDRILAMSTLPNVVVFGGDAAFTGGTDNLTYFKSIFTRSSDRRGHSVGFRHRQP